MKEYRGLGKLMKYESIEKALSYPASSFLSFLCVVIHLKLNGVRCAYRVCSRKPSKVYFLSSFLFFGGKFCNLSIDHNFQRLLFMTEGAFCFRAFTIAYFSIDVGTG